MAEHTFVAMWCSEGLEYLRDVTHELETATWAALKGEHYTSKLPNLNHLELRARYNSQRHYEIYAFDADEGITEEDIRELFDSDPQHIVDLIRVKGQKIYGEPAKKNKVVIV
jgi:hypothetical protein